MSKEYKSMGQSRIAAIFIVIQIGFTLFHSDFKIGSFILILMSIVDLPHSESMKEDAHNFTFTSTQQTLIYLCCSLTLIFLRSLIFLEMPKINVATILSGLLLSITNIALKTLKVFHAKSFINSFLAYSISLPICILISTFFFDDNFITVFVIYVITTSRNFQIFFTFSNHIHQKLILL